MKKSPSLKISNKKIIQCLQIKKKTCRYKKARIDNNSYRIEQFKFTFTKQTSLLGFWKLKSNTM